MNLVQRIAGAARFLATGKLAQSTGLDGAQMQRRLLAWRAGGESINSLILQGGELQRARARQLVRTNPYAANASSSLPCSRSCMIAVAVNNLLCDAMRNLVCGVIGTFLPVSAKPNPLDQISC